MELIGVTEGVLRYLRAHIITGAIAPGQKLNEIELSTSLGISRPPLREAFRVLEKEHLLVSAPRKGCVVSDLSIEDCRNVYGVRAMMECYAVETLALRGIRELPQVRAALEKTDRLVSPDENDAYARYEYLRVIADFHIKLVEAAGNLILDQLFISIFPTLARYQSVYTYIPSLMEESRIEHGQVLRYIKEGHHAKAKELLDHHINKFVELIVENIKSKSNGKKKSGVA